MLRAAFTSALQASPQAVHWKAAWLSRLLPVDVPARAAALRRVRGWYSLNPSGCLLLQGADQAVPIRLAGSPGSGRLSGRRSGRAASAVPLAERIIATDVEVLRHGSRRSGARDRWRSSPPSPCAGRSRGPSTWAIAGLDLAATVRPAPGPGELALRAQQAGALSARSSPGTASISPVDRAAVTVTPRSTPTTSPVPGVRDADRGSRRTRHASGPARSRVTRNDFTPVRYRHGTSGTAPSPAFGTSTCAQLSG